MALSKGFPAVSGGATFLDIRRDLETLFARDSSGEVRAGINAPEFSALVTATGSMGVVVGDFRAVLRRSGAVIIANPSPTTVPLGPAPASGSRIDVVYVKQVETQPPFSDAGPAGPIFGVLEGTPDPQTPVKRSDLPAGALELAAVTIPAGAITTQSADVSISNTYQMTAAFGAPVPFRTVTELRAWAAQSGSLARVSGGGPIYRRSGSSWLPYIGSVFARRTGSAAHPNGTLAPLGMANGTSTDTLAINLGLNAIIVQNTGWYDITGNIGWQGNNSGSRVLEVQVEGSGLTPPISSRAPAVSGSQASVSGRVFLQAGNVVRLAGFQDSGGDLNYTCSLVVEWASS